jgi:dTDP-4-dehydrorhamnose reductase
VKVLIAGAAGQVGRALVDSAPTPIEVVKCSHQNLDVADERVVLSCIRSHAPDVIVNAAAYTAVDRAESEPELARRVNSDGPRYLALAAREVGARLVHVSTDFVFDGASSIPYPPEAPTNPLNVYGVTKRAGEQAVLEVLPGRSVVLRTSWLYAAQGSNFVRTMLRLMCAKGAVRVVADQVGTPTAARSVAQAIWKITEWPSVTGIHHWSDAGVASWYDFAVAIADIAALRGLLASAITVTPISTEEYPTAARRPRYSVLDKRSLAVLGIAPVHWRRQLQSVLGELGRA